MVSRIDYSPQAPGPDMSSKYPIAPGPNYQKWKEQKGFIYDPYHDRYVADPKAQQELAYSQGLAERPKEPPGLFESLAPVAGVGTALYGGKWLGEHGFDKIAGMFGGGDAAKTVADTGSKVAGSFVESAGANGFSPVGMDAANYFPESTGFFDLSSGGLMGEGAMPMGNYLPGIAGAYGGYDLLTNDYGPGRGALQGAASGAGIGFTVGGPVGAGIGAGIGGGIGLIKGLFGDHETTKEAQTGNWSKLAQSSDPATAAYAKQYLDVIAQGDGSGRTYQEIKSDPNSTGRDVWGAKAFFDAVPGWLSEYSEDQREQIAKRSMDANLLKGSKGDILGTDSGSIKKIADEVKAATAPQPAPRQQSRPQPSRSTQRRK